MKWRVYLWNTLTTLSTAAALAFMTTSFGLVWPYFMPLLAVMFVVRWAFPGRDFARWHTFLGWLYAGIVIGVAFWMADAVNALWKAVLIVPVVLLVGAGLPDSWRDLYWAFRTWRARPAPWSTMQAQSRAEVIEQAPIRMVEVTETTQQVSGGVAQEAQSSISYELRWGDIVITSEKTPKAAEDWLLNLYRRYRKWRRLPLALELQADHTQVTRDEQPLSLYTTPQWQRGRLTPAQVLAWGPYRLSLEYTNWTAQVIYHPDGSRQFWSDGNGDPRESYPIPLELLEANEDDPEHHDPYGPAPQVRAVSLILAATGQVISRHPDLISAESEVLSLYTQQCPVEAWASEVPERPDPYPLN